MTPRYEAVDRLGLEIRTSPMPHIAWDDIRSAIGAAEYSEFEDWMERKTVLPNGPYPWDVERFLTRVKGA